MTRALVLNATGKVSASVIANLRAAGHEVVAASRAPSNTVAGVRAVRFDYADPKTHAAALDGVDRVFWVGPPLVLDTFGYTKAFLELATKRVKKIVVMTASGVEHSDAIPLRQVELLVERSGTAWTHLRPTWFMDNFHTFWLAPMKHEGVIPLPAGDSRTAFVDARDIGASAAAALVSSASDGKAYTITGPEALTYAEAAAVIAKAAGRDMRYVAIDDEAFVAGGVKAGLPEEYARMLAFLFGNVRNGAAAHVSQAVRELTGKAPRTFADYARENAAAWAR